MNTGVFLSLEILISIPFGVYISLGLLATCVDLFLIFKKNSIPSSIVAETFYTIVICEF